MNTSMDKYEKHLEQFRENEEYINYFVDLVREKLREIPNELEELLKIIYEIGEEQGYEKSRGEIYLYLGWIYHDRAIYKQAIEFYMDAKLIFEKYENESGLGRLYNALLMTHLEQGRLEDAMHYGVMGIEIAKKIKEGRLEFGILLNMIIAYLQFEEIEKAENLIKGTEDVSYYLDDVSVGLVKKLKASLLLKKGEYDLAYKEIIQVLKVFKEKKLVYLYAETYATCASILNNLKKFDEALLCLQNGLEWANKLEQKNKQVDIQYIYSEFYVHKKDYVRAEEHIYEAINLAKEIEAQLSLEKLYKELSTILKCQKRYEEALEMIEIHNNFKEYIFNDTCQKVYEEMTKNNEQNLNATYVNMYKKMQSILKVGQMLTSKLSQKEIIEVIRSEINQVIKYISFSVGIYEQQSQTINAHFYQKDKSFKVVDIDIHSNTSIAAYCFKNQKDLIIYDIEKDYNEYVMNWQVVKGNGKVHANSILYCPLIVQGQVIGTISVQHTEKNFYTLQDLNTLKLFAVYIATALWNARLFEEVQYLADYDGLTKVLNRKAIMSKGKEYFATSDKEENPLSVMMMDLDYFKKVNDMYGHDVGDRALQHFAGVVEQTIVHPQQIGRYGGEEFILIAPDTNHEQIMLLAETIRKEVEASVFEEINGHKLHLTVSLGVYTFCGEEKDFYEGVKYADIALYEAKESGRNTVIHTIYEDVKDYKVNKKYEVTKEGDIR